MAATASKSAHPFAQQQQWNYQFEDSYLPKFYEQDVVYQSQRTTFRSVSPKMYNQQKMDYFSDMKDELDMVDNEDSLYEATLMNADFLSLTPCTLVQEKEEEEEEKPSSSLSRLRQILSHINPNYAPESLALPDATPAPSVRSQFSADSSSSLFQQQQQNTPTSAMRAFSISDPRDPKGKGKFRSTM